MSSENHIQNENSRSSQISEEDWEEQEEKRCRMESRKLRPERELELVKIIAPVIIQTHVEAKIAQKRFSKSTSKRAVIFAREVLREIYPEAYETSKVEPEEEDNEVDE